jgi:peptidoglycan/LPS O-acetylase OafA/YrhL
VKSASGSHFVALDHVRAIAALLVFLWHFVHGNVGYPAPLSGAPFWGPLVLSDEGHVGVALFMTLSGYLFAKLLDGRQIIFVRFLMNRALRLLPLMCFVLAIGAALAAYSANDLRAAYWFILKLPKGLIFPTLPNGLWSVTVELHFYIVLPILLWLLRSSTCWLLALLAAAVLLRAYLWASLGEIQSLSYWTFIGRIDQFILGMVAFSLGDCLRGRHMIAAVVVSIFVSFYLWFDTSGGFFEMGGYPSKSVLWVFMPTLEGLAFCTLIAWYDRSFVNLRGRFSDFVAKIGEYSYSIYLLHVFFVFGLAEYIHRHVLNLWNFYVATAVGFVAFLFMIPLGYLSMMLIERPFLRLRVSYIRKQAVGGERKQGMATLPASMGARE